MPNKTKHLVAVYGSLRLGMSNASVNDRAEATFLGKGNTKEDFNLYQYGGGYFPCVSLAHSSNKTPVVVDVFEVSQDGLEGPYDALEGYPGFYNRTEIIVKMYNDDLVKAWIYHIDEKQEVLVTSGDWVDWKTDPLNEDDEFDLNAFINNIN